MSQTQKLIWKSSQWPKLDNLNNKINNLVLNYNPKDKIGKGMGPR